MVQFNFFTCLLQSDMFFFGVCLFHDVHTFLWKRKQVVPKTLGTIAAPTKDKNPGTTGKEAQQKPKEEEQVASFRAMGA